MAVYRQVHLFFWTDTKVVDDFTPEDRYFMLYCLTNPYTNIIGCYEISAKQIADGLGYSKERVEKLIERFQGIHQIIEYDKNNKEMFIKNWSKYNWTTSFKLDKPILEAIKGVKTHRFKKILVDLYNARDTVSIPYEYRMDTIDTVSVTDTVSVADTVSVDNSHAKKKMPPTLEEVIEYCGYMGYHIDPAGFYDYYSSNGWKVGKNPMKDWKAAVRNWVRNQRSSGQSCKQAGVIGEMKELYDKCKAEEETGCENDKN